MKGLLIILISAVVAAVSGADVYLDSEYVSSCAPHCLWEDVSLWSTKALPTSADSVKLVNPFAAFFDVLLNTTRTVDALEVNGLSLTISNNSIFNVVDHTDIVDGQVILQGAFSCTHLSVFNGSNFLIDDGGTYETPITSPVGSIVWLSADSTLHLHPYASYFVNVQTSIFEGMIEVSENATFAPYDGSTSLYNGNCRFFGDVFLTNVTFWPNQIFTFGGALMSQYIYISTNTTVVVNSSISIAGSVVFADATSTLYFQEQSSGSSARGSIGGYATNDGVYSSSMVGLGTTIISNSTVQIMWASIFGRVEFRGVNFVTLNNVQLNSTLIFSEDGEGVAPYTSFVLSGDTAVYAEQRIFGEISDTGLLVDVNFYASTRFSGGCVTSHGAFINIYSGAELSCDSGIFLLDIMALYDIPPTLTFYNGGLLAAPQILLTGSGTIVPNTFGSVRGVLINEWGTVYSRLDRALTITGDYVQKENGTLECDFFEEDSIYNQDPPFQVSGNVQLGGKVTAEFRSLSAVYSSTSDLKLPVIKAGGSISGNFTSGVFLNSWSYPYTDRELELDTTSDPHLVSLVYKYVGDTDGAEKIVANAAVVWLMMLVLWGLL